VAFSLWLAALLIAGEHGWIHQRALSHQTGALHEEVVRLEDQLHGLRQRGPTDSADPFVVEQVARETFGLARPGEVVYRFDEANVTGTEPKSRPRRMSAGALDIAVSDR
jgi:cell division protein FtsB